MSFNTFGKIFRFTTWGESHGPAIGCVVDGCPPNINLNKKDIQKHKLYKNISDIILFDGKGYEKSFGFDHNLLNNVPNTIKKMLAGNIKYNEALEKFSKIADIIDVSGSLETKGKKDISKINILLNKAIEIKNEN